MSRSLLCSLLLNACASFSFFFSRKRENTIHFCYSLDFNYYGSWKVIETMDQKLVEWMERRECGCVSVSVCWVGRWMVCIVYIFGASAAFTQSNLRHRWMKNFNKIQWLQSTWNTSKCTFKWFWFVPDWYLVSRAKEHAWMCYTRIHYRCTYCTHPLIYPAAKPPTHIHSPFALNARRFAGFQLKIGHKPNVRI